MCLTITKYKHCALLLSFLTNTALPACTSVFTLLPYIGAMRGLVDLWGPVSKNTVLLFGFELTGANQASRKDRL